jgi:hypothetical protein
MLKYNENRVDAKNHEQFSAWQAQTWPAILKQKLFYVEISFYNDKDKGKK